MLYYTKEKRNEYNRQWYLKNAPRLRLLKNIANSKPERKQKTKEYWNEYYKIPRNRIHSLVVGALNRAKNKKQDFDVPFMQQLELNPPTHCKCCQEELNYCLIVENKHQSKKTKSPSLDRVDNTKGYVKDNVSIICNECNINKSNMSLKQLKQLVKYTEEYSNHD